MFRYRLQSPDGNDLGESTYAVPINPGEEILVGDGTRYHVLAVVACEEEDAAPFVALTPFAGLLQVAAASAPTVRPSGTAPSARTA